MSPQKLFAVVLVLTTVALASSGVVSSQNANTVRCAERERQALLKFKAELVDDFGRLSSWGNGEEKPDCCKWRGVHCHNKTDHVVRLDLHTTREEIDSLAFLKGTISTSLLELQHLQYLDLSLNHFDSAPLPEFIGSLSELRYLNLSYCHFTGPIPYHLENLTNLVTLDLGSNLEITGPIPNFIGSLGELRHLYLYECNFTGPIPYHLSNLSKLFTLDLYANFNLHSKSLGWVSQLQSLEVLDLGHINLSLSNNWLEAISKLTNLKELHLVDSALPNILHSLLPPIMINASTSLAILDLRNNSDLNSTLALSRWFSNRSSSLVSIDLSYTNMQGSIPDVFQNMVSLEHLDLTGTGLQGGIPKYIGNISSLRYLNLAENNLTQASECCLQLPYLEVLDLTSNNIKGPIPNLSGLCPSLKELTLDHNMLNGTLNGHIGGLSKLESLSIGSNLLVDTITESHILFNLTQLRTLDLSFNYQLRIKLNPNWIPSFQLEYIRVSRCDLGPNFPVWLQTQKKLKFIDISDVGITDTIPTWFGAMTTELVMLNASNNHIHGAIPKFSFSNKHHGSPSSTMILDLSRNNISGPINFLCQIQDWEFLNLSENQLSGQIPQCFENFESLEYLNLESIHFGGQIPNLHGGELSLVNLRNNKFTGELPTSLRNCTHLDNLDLGGNRLRGDIPAWIGDSLPRLKFLVLRSNEFYGSIPTSLCNLKDVQILDLSANNISGVIPKCVSNWTAMTTGAGTYSRFEMDSVFIIGHEIVIQIHGSSVESAHFMWKRKEVNYINQLCLVKLLDLSANSLDGEIPSEITKLDGLIELNLSRNYFIGFIPPNIGEMKSLDSLDLSNNHLSGSIPPSISGLSQLGMLNLSYNHLSGRIPQDNQALTFEESGFVGNPGLCGIQLNKSCPGDLEPQNPSSNGKNTLDSNDDELVTDGFYISVAIGFVCAFLGVFWTTVLNKSIGDALFSRVFKRFH